MNPSRSILWVVSLIAACWLGGSEVHAQDGRDYVRVIGRPETLVYAAEVATAMSRTARRKFPQIEQSSDEGARRTFCTTVRDSPDVMLIAIGAEQASDRICNTPQPILRLPIGRQAFVLYMAPGAQPFALTREQLYRALARDLPRRNGDGSPEAGFERNPNKSWHDISPDLPDIPIRLLGPPRRAVQWLTLEDLVMRPGCRTVPAIIALERLDPQAAAQRCVSRRTDQAVSYADGAAYAERPAVVPHGTEVAINERRTLTFVPGATLLPVEGVLPDDSSLEADHFVLARPVVAVVKRDRLDTVPNLRNFIVEITSDAAAGNGGYLLRGGLDPLSARQLGRSALIAHYARPGETTPLATASAEPSASK